jgi:hypothetical protein
MVLMKQDACYIQEAEYLSNPVTSRGANTDTFPVASSGIRGVYAEVWI